jgi:hypothetical protein
LAVHLLYGLRAVDRVAEAVEVIAERLGCVFQERESHYMGEYWLAKIESTTVKIVTQPDSYGDPVENSFADYGLLMYVDGDTPVPNLDGTRVGDNVMERLGGS